MNLDNLTFTLDTYMFLEMSTAILRMRIKAVDKLIKDMSKPL